MSLGFVNNYYGIERAHSLNETAFACLSRPISTIFSQKVILSNAFPLNIASASIPLDEVVRMVTEDIPGEVFSDESQEVLSVHGGSESEDQGSEDNQDFNDCGDSDADNHSNGMF